MAVFRTDPLSSETITDPPVGVTTVTGDFDSFDPTLQTVPPPRPSLFVSASSGDNNAGATTVNIASPVGAFDGDIFYAIITYDGQGAHREIATPSGWIAAGFQTLSNGDGGLAFFLKFINGPFTPTAYAFTCEISTQMTGAILCIRNGNYTGDGGYNGVTTGSTSHPPGADITVAKPGLLFLASALTVAGNQTPPSGFDEIVEATSNNYSALSVSMVTVNDAAANYGQPNYTSSVSSATQVTWIDFPGIDPVANVAYAGWVQLRLTRTANIRFDTIGSEIQDTKLSIGTAPEIYPTWVDDDTSLEPYASSDDDWGWSTIPDDPSYARYGGTVPAPGFMLLHPGLYYIRVWPYAATGWDPDDPVDGGDATLNITVDSYPTVIYDIVDNIEDVVTITDPPVGTIFATGDFTNYTTVASDPTAPGWDQDFSGWLRLVLTEDMYLAFDTYGSGMFDTVMLIYNDDPPTVTSLDFDGNDDTFEEPYVSGARTFRQSSIVDPGGITKLWAAGTYWIEVVPYNGPEWLAPPQTGIDPPETGDVLIHITRTGVSFPVGIRPGLPIEGSGLFPPVGQSTVVISYDGTDITDHVLIDRARFTSLVNGSPGAASLTVRDDDHDQAFVTGKELTLDIDGTRFWGGYVRRVKRTMPLPVMDTTDAEATPRYWDLEAVDYNILFDKRIVFDAANPDTKIAFDYPVATYDDDIIIDLFDNYLDIGGDGISRSGVTRVDIVTLDIKGVTSGRGSLNKGRGQVASAGYTWKQAMDVIARATGAVYYIDPNKVFHYVDVDTEDATWKLRDHPTDPERHVGYAEFRLLYDGSRLINDMLVWGAGTFPIVFSRKQSTPSKTAHHRWQSGLYTQGMIHQSAVDIVAQSYLDGTPQSKRGAKDDAISLECRVFRPYFHVGEKVEVQLSIFGFSAVIPIRSMTIAFVNPHQATYDLILSHEIDQPLSFFEMAPLRVLRYPVPNFHFPQFPPPPCIGGIVTMGNGWIVDSFTRSVPDISTHAGYNPNYSWDAGENITWNGWTFFANTHYSVGGGFGRIEAKVAHYQGGPLTEAVMGGATTPIDWGNQKSQSGGISGDISIKTMLIKFRVARTNKIVNAFHVSHATSGTLMPAWTNISAVDDLDNTYNNTTATPDFTTAATIPNAVVEGPVDWDLVMQPDPSDTGYGAIVGTIVYSPAGLAGYDFTGWYVGDRAGFLHVGTEIEFIPSTVTSFHGSFPNTGLHFMPGVAANAIFYEGTDIRDASEWDNRVGIAFSDTSSAYITLENGYGGTTYGVKTRSQGGDAVVDLDGAINIDPDVWYWLEWQRPSLAESYVRIWADGALRPDDTIASFLSDASTAPAEPNHNFRVQAIPFVTQQYALDVEVIASGDVRPCPVAPGGGTGDQLHRPGFIDGFVYQLPFAFAKGSTRVWVNGLRFRLDIDYTEQTGPGTITFASALADTDKVSVLYTAFGTIT